MSRIDDEENSSHRAFKVPPSREVKERRKSASMGFEESKIYEETSIGLSLRAMLDDLVLDDIDLSSNSSTLSPSKTRGSVSSLPSRSSIDFASPVQIYESFLSNKLGELSENTPSSIYKLAKNLIQMELENLNLHQDSSEREIGEKKNKFMDKYHRLIFDRDDRKKILSIFHQSMEKKMEELSQFRGLNGQFSGYLDHYNIQTSQNSKIQLARIQTSQVQGSFTNKYGNRIVPVEDGILRIFSSEGKNFRPEKKKSIRKSKGHFRKKSKVL